MDMVSYGNRHARPEAGGGGGERDNLITASFPQLKEPLSNEKYTQSCKDVKSCNCGVVSQNAGFWYF